ncbi:hypothetical protein [Halorussus halophilus]|uniref:hypothetical protein n=1 Tax=Halorussus halophilus TaxID=2650975 RepID=UPI00130186AB|nr:hypothetical protein [Halorussus halophilus]
MSDQSHRYRRLAVALVGTLLLAARAAAHGGALRASAGSLSVPTWLFLLTGGGVVGASFLLASFVTDRAFVRSIHDWHRTAAVDSVLNVGAKLTRALSVVVLAGIVAIGLFGPDGPDAAFRNAAILVVWVGWWAGYVATVYLVGNSWPAVNPWRAIADVLPSFGFDYPEKLGAWPSVVGLLALVWVEVVSPLADDPALLALVILGYSAFTLSGALLFGTDTWFETVDPVSRVFSYYGRVAPVQRTEEGNLELRLPGAALTEPKLVDGADEVAFVVALLWVTTYDGLVGTGAWETFARTVVGAGVPAVLLYPTVLLVGFGLFWGAYRLAARYSRKTAETYLTPQAIGRRLAPSLLPIAAGYHLAHFLGYFISLSPVLVGVLQNPMVPPINPVVIVLPAWFGMLAVTFVLVGHLLAVWVAHATAYDVFPGRLQAVRSQYPFVVVMVLYTMTSLWIVSTPSGSPPFV